MFYATGVAHDGGDLVVLWHEAADPGLDHKALALGYRRMAEAPDPLDPAVCTAELRLGLNRQLHLHWSSRWRREGRGEKASLAAVDWAALSAGEQEEIRGMARHLATWHGSHVRRGAPHKNVLDTLLEQLALIYAQHSGLKEGHHDLPYAPASRFLQFASLALAPFFAASEVSAVALARRLHRARTAAVRRPLSGNPTTPSRDGKGGVQRHR
ncbi:MAG: hypothetical protein H0T41_07425 [Rhodobacteraceae bacterium]|nr:hypothetical protein [Paracoccaceae bacterium]